MNWDALGALGELFGGLIVLVTVVYLARQIRESNKHARAQAERDVQSHWSDRVLDASLLNPSVRTVMRRGHASFNNLKEDEKTVFMLGMTHVLNQLELVLRMEKDGLLSSEVANFYRAIVLSNVLTPGGREYWDIGQGVYQELSTDYINSNIDSTEVPPLTETLPFWRERPSNQ